MREVYVRSWRATFDDVLPRSVHPNALVEAKFDTFDLFSARVRTNVATDDRGSVIGFVRVDLERSELCQIFTWPVGARPGVGAALLRKARQEVAGRDLHLWVWTQNGRAKRFYARNGWRHTGVRAVQRNGGITFQMERWTTKDR
jgi:GNAT superfamily N-acetyltransferase